MNRIDNTHATFLNCLRDWSDPFLNGHASNSKKSRVHNPSPRVASESRGGTLGCVRCDSCSCRLDSTIASTSSSSHLDSEHRPTSATKSPRRADSALAVLTGKHQSPRGQYPSPRLFTPSLRNAPQRSLITHPHDASKSNFKPIIKPSSKKTPTPLLTPTVACHKSVASSKAFSSMVKTASKSSSSISTAKTKSAGNVASSDEAHCLATGSDESIGKDDETTTHSEPCATDDSSSSLLNYPIQMVTNDLENTHVGNRSVSECHSICTTSKSLACDEINIHDDEVDNDTDAKQRHNEPKANTSYSCSSSSEHTSQHQLDVLDVGEEEEEEDDDNGSGKHSEHNNVIYEDSLHERASVCSFDSDR
jgi:hypothetical protein